MFPQVYDGNTHPDEWLQQITAYCFLKKFDDDVEFAKMMINSTICVPKDVASLTELASALKSDISFKVFRNTNKRKLQALRYKSENVGGDTAKFIDAFRKLCRNAEITDLEEQKKYFIDTLPYEFKNKFLDKIDDDNIGSLNDIISRFNDLFIEPTIDIDVRNIKNGSTVALKHVATGRYLSTIENLRYNSGSKSQIAFLGSEIDRSSLWIIKFDKDFATTDTPINLQQRFGKFDRFLGIRYTYNTSYNRRDNYHKSPSGNTEVSCNIMNGNDNDRDWRFDFSKLSDQEYLKQNDIITLAFKNEVLNDRYEYLRGNDYQITIGGDTYHEVVCHDKGVGANDNWCIELIE